MLAMFKQGKHNTIVSGIQKLQLKKIYIASKMYLFFYAYNF